MQEQLILLKEKLEYEYEISISLKWVKNYAWNYGHLVPSKKGLTINECIEDAIRNTERFVYFIHGTRATYKPRRNKTSQAKARVKNS